jgi:hypothetical protein
MLAAPIRSSEIIWAENKPARAGSQLSSTQWLARMQMNDLLSLAVNAHGGPSRWNQLKGVKARLSITGTI